MSASPRRTALLGLLLLLPLLACGKPEHRARGTVEDVDVEAGQAVIAHEDIPGVMPAMTMNFSIADPELLARLRPGQVIDFTLQATQTGYWVMDAEVVGQVEPDERWVKMGDAVVPSDPAPPFDLIDQAGAPQSLSGLAGKTLLVDFIFTTCPGPCPILTARHVAVQRKLPESVRGRAHFVSISLDPTTDTPEALRAYAEKHGADLEAWSFLTGPEDRVAQVVRAWGVGTTRDTEGELQHLVVAFLVDGQGRIVKRYMGLEPESAAIARDIETLASS